MGSQPSRFNRNVTLRKRVAVAVTAAASPAVAAAAAVVWAAAAAPGVGDAAAVAGGLVALAALVTWRAGVWLRASVAEPLRHLADLARAFRRGEYDSRAQVYGDDEIGELARNLNSAAAGMRAETHTLVESARRDELTGLFNRREFDNRFEEELQRARRYGRVCAVMLCDIDHFKQVNDTYGHAVGDEVLIALAGRLHSAVRPTDVVARFGGEEFAVLLSETAVEDAEAVAERLRQVVSADPVGLRSGGALPVTVSVGVAGCPEHAQEAEEALNAADHALYTAKERGRDRVEVADPARMIMDEYRSE